MTSAVEKKSTKGCPQAKELLKREVSCLECPLPKCLLDSSISPKTIREDRRNLEILKLLNEGKKEKELAEIFHLHIKTIQRILIKTRKEVTI